MTGESSSTRHGSEPRHIVVLGNAVDRLEPVVSDLRAQGVRVTVPRMDATYPDAPITMLVLAMTLNARAGDNIWRSQLDTAWGIVNNTLPRLASSATGLLIGFTNARSPWKRRKARRAMHGLIAHFETQAAGEFGDEFTINALEVPDAGPHGLLHLRLIPFLSRRTTFANSAVVSLEDLEDNELAAALTSTVV